MMGEYMMMLPIVGALIMYAGLAWMRSGHGGEVGRRIRNSDYWAWEMAVEDKERELAELKRAKPTPLRRSAKLL